MNAGAESGDIFTDVTVWLANDLRIALAWLERQMQDIPVATSLDNKLFTLHIEIVARLAHYQEQIGVDVAPWFAIDQYPAPWWGWDCWAYDSFDEAARAMRGAVGWVTVRGMEGPVWFGPDRDDTWLDEDECQLPSTLSEMVEAEVNALIDERRPAPESAPLAVRHEHSIWGG